jgi:hypothetical protein
MDAMIENNFSLRFSLHCILGFLAGKYVRVHRQGEHRRPTATHKRRINTVIAKKFVGEEEMFWRVGVLFSYTGTRKYN